MEGEKKSQGPVRMYQREREKERGVGEKASLDIDFPSLGSPQNASRPVLIYKASLKLLVTKLLGSISRHNCVL